MKNYERLDANTLKIIKPVEVQEEISTYQYQDLVTRVLNLQTQKDSFNADIDAQITDAQAAVDAANSLGIIAEVATPIEIGK